MLLHITLALSAHRPHPSRKRVEYRIQSEKSNKKKTIKPHRAEHLFERVQNFLHAMVGRHRKRHCLHFHLLHKSRDTTNAQFFFFDSRKHPKSDVSTGFYGNPCAMLRMLRFVQTASAKEEEKYWKKDTSTIRGRAERVI